MKSQHWSISGTFAKSKKHYYTPFTHEKYHNYPADHKKFENLKFVIVTLKSNTTEQTNVLSNNFDSYFIVDYTKLMMDIVLFQKTSLNDTVTPEQLRSFLVCNSKAND